MSFALFGCGNVGVVDVLRARLNCTVSVGGLEYDGAAVTDSCGEGEPRQPETPRAALAAQHRRGSLAFFSRAVWQMCFRSVHRWLSAVGEMGPQVRLRVIIG